MVPALEDYMPVTVMPQPVKVGDAATVGPPGSTSATRGAAGQVEDEMVDAANARELARHLSECSEPDFHIEGLSFAKDAGDQNRTEPTAKRPRYSKHGFEPGSSDMEIENLICEKKGYVLELLANMKTHDSCGRAANSSHQHSDLGREGAEDQGGGLAQ